MRSKIKVFIFLVPIFLISILNILTSNASQVSNLENRKIKEMPDLNKKNLFSGNYFRSYDEYFSDTFFKRDDFIEVSKKINDLRGIKLENEVKIVRTSGVNVAVKLSEEDKNEKLLQNENFGNILLVDDIAMEVNTFNKQALDYYSKIINEVSNKYKNQKVYSMLVPTQIEFIDSKEFKDISYPQNKTIETINKNLNSDIYKIDVYEVLKEKKDEYIYFKTDHHWTARGAYYAYQEFMKQTNRKPRAINEFEIISEEGYLGTLYNATQSETLKNSKDIVEVFEINGDYKMWRGDKELFEGGKVIDLKYLKEDTKYQTFMEGDWPLLKVHTNLKNSKKILIIKDSYANAFIPFLINHYEEIYVVDPRLYTGNIEEVINKNEVKEILFLNYVLVNRYDGFAKLIEDMFFEDTNIKQEIN